MNKKQIEADYQLINKIDSILDYLVSITQHKIAYDGNSTKVEIPSPIDRNDLGYIVEYKLNLGKFLINSLKARNESNKRNKSKRRSRNRKSTV
jgi:hypothetical protein